MMALNLTYANSDRSSVSRSETMRRVPHPEKPGVREFKPQEVFYTVALFQIGKSYSRFAVNLEQDEDERYVASDDIFLVYGDGTSVTEALVDYATSLVELYQIVQEGALTNPLDREQLRRLQYYVQTEVDIRQ